MTMAWHPESETSAVELIPGSIPVLGGLVDYLQVLATLVRDYLFPLVDSYLVKGREDIVSELNFSNRSVADSSHADPKTGNSLL